MEKCKFCQAELAEDTTLCPQCGKDNAETADMTAEETIPAEVSAEDTAPAAEETETAAETASVGEETAPVEETASAEEEAKPEPRKATPGKIALAVAAVVVLIAALAALVMMGMNSKTEAPAETGAVEETVPATVPADGNPDDETCKGTYTGTDEETLNAKDTVVATMGDAQLTNGDLQVYYWSMVNNYLSSEFGYYMMMYGGIDYTKPLDTQISYEDQTRTWQQYFLRNALEYWQMSQALALEAEKAGISMTAEDQEYLDNMEANLQATADSYGMTLDELMLNNVGPGAGVKEFTDFQALYSRGSRYYNEEVAKFVPTEAELETFFAEHEADYASSGVTKDSEFVDVRHILVSIKGGTTDENGTTTYTDEEWAACETEAQAILDQWLAGDKTEDSFAALAGEKSEDPGSSNNGGLYEDVYVGQMVPTFNDWCFDDSRQYADYGLVKTDYGYHIMFFVGSELQWKSYAEKDWITEQTNQFTANLLENHPMEVSYKDIVLGYVNFSS